MIYIISGASRSGKTIIGKTMLKEEKIPYVSLDYLMMGFMHGVKEMGIHDKLWPNEIAEKMWRFLEPYIETIIYSNEDYIIEGEAILPKLISQLKEKHKDQISVCFVGYADVDINQKMEDIKTHASKNDWLVPLGDKEIKSHVQNMIGYSQKIKEEAKKYNLPYIDTSHHFQDSLQQCIDVLKKTNES